MRLKHDIHLAYCTNIHRGQNWTETFDTLVKYASGETIPPKIINEDRFFDASNAKENLAGAY